MNERVASLIAGIARLLAGATVRSSGFRPDPAPRIYYANHTSHLDSVVVWSALPREVRRATRPVAAREYWDASALRRYLSREIFNALLIERDPAARTGSPVDQMLAAIDGGCSLIIFPEGTRGSGEEIASFKSGIYRLALARPGLELVPIYMENLGRILPKGEIVPVPLLSTISVGLPIRLEEGETKETFLGRARGELMRMKEKRE